MTGWQSPAKKSGAPERDWENPQGNQLMELMEQRKPQEKMAQNAVKKVLPLGKDTRGNLARTIQGPFLMRFDTLSRRCEFHHH
jgi:hypothetical protein